MSFATSSVVHGQRGMPVKVLIADDHDDTCTVLSAELAAEGHEVEVVATGAEALGRTLANRPDVVFLGPTLAIHDGYETCAILRADPDVPERLPIYMLGAADLDHRRMERIGASGSLSRTHGAAEVRELMSRLLFSP